MSAPDRGAAPAAARRAYTVPFAELRAADLPLVGGKGANLGELRHAGFPVPDGFCVTTDAFVRFLEAAPDWSGLLGALGALDVEDVAAVREVGARVRGALAALDVPDDVAADVARSWTALGADDGVRGPLERDGRGPPRRLVRRPAGHVPERAGRDGAARRDPGLLDLALHRPGDRLPGAQRLRAGRGAPGGRGPAHGGRRGLGRALHRRSGHAASGDPGDRRGRRFGRGAGGRAGGARRVPRRPSRTGGPGSHDRRARRRRHSAAPDRRARAGARAHRQRCRGPLRRPAGRRVVDRRRPSPRAAGATDHLALPDRRPALAGRQPARLLQHRAPAEHDARDDASGPLDRDGAAAGRGRRRAGPHLLACGRRPHLRRPDPAAAPPARAARGADDARPARRARPRRHRGGDGAAGLPTPTTAARHDRPGADVGGRRAPRRRLAGLARPHGLPGADRGAHGRLRARGPRAHPRRRARARACRGRVERGRLGLPVHRRLHARGRRGRGGHPRADAARPPLARSPSPRSAHARRARQRRERDEPRDRRPRRDGAALARPPAAASTTWATTRPPGWPPRRRSPAAARSSRRSRRSSSASARARPPRSTSRCRASATPRARSSR